MKKIFHFAMIGGILNFISFCVDSMRSVQNNNCILLFNYHGNISVQK